MDTTKFKQICIATSRNGTPCKRIATQNDYCFSHIQTKEAIAKRKKVASIAGSAIERLPAHKTLRIKNSGDLYNYLSLVLTEIATGRIKMTAKNLKDLTNLSKVFIETESKSNLLKRIEKIEEERRNNLQ